MAAAGFGFLYHLNRIRLALLGEPDTLRVEEGKITLGYNLPRQAVSLVVLEWGKKAPW